MPNDDDDSIHLTIHLYELKGLLQGGLPVADQHAIYALMMLGSIAKSARGYADCVDCAGPIGPGHPDPKLVAIIECGDKVSGALMCPGCADKPDAVETFKNRLTDTFAPGDLRMIHPEVGHA